MHQIETDRKPFPDDSTKYRPINPFGITMVDQSMEPEIPVGKTIVIDAGYIPTPGDIAFFQLADGRNLVRRYQPLPDGSVVLQARNQEFANITLEQSEGIEAYPVHSMIFD